MRMIDDDFEKIDSPIASNIVKLDEWFLLCKLGL